MPQLFSIRWVYNVLTTVLYASMLCNSLSPIGCFVVTRINKICGVKSAEIVILASTVLNALRYSSSSLFFLFNGTCANITWSNRTIFRVTGPLCGEFTGTRWIPLTKASDAELWRFLSSAPWINGWVNNREVVIWDGIALIMTSLLWKVSVLITVCMFLHVF